jgi:type 1 glutamine amidotransferase
MVSATSPGSPPISPAATALDLLLCTRTAGYRHASIEASVDALLDLARAEGWTFTHSEDGASFDLERLSRHHAVILMNSTGDFLNVAQRSAFETYVARGGGVVAVHAAAMVEFEWPFYEALIGAHFVNHPEPQRGVVRVEDRDHPATEGLPEVWEWHEEWYNFAPNPRDKVRVLASVDEASYHGGTMGDHPLVWCHERLGGRCFYTGLGHESAAYSDPRFMAHLAGAIRWAARKPR